MSGKGKKHLASHMKELGAKSTRKTIHLEQKLDMIHSYERNEEM
jgi:hypothetical protein